MHLRRLITIPIALLAACLAGAYALRNPEHRDMDSSARQGVSGKFATLGDGVTHYDVAGPDDGQRVVLVHGFSVPAYIWDSTFIALTGAGFRVVRYDQFGRGYSDRPDIPYTSDVYDRQLTQLLDSVGWRDKVDVIGLSNGGPVSAKFAARHPDRVRSVTLVDPAAGTRTAPALMFRIPLLGPVLWQTMAVPGMADGQLTDFVEPSKWPDWTTRYREQMQFRGFGRALLSTIREAQGEVLDSVYAKVGTLGTPTLLIWGVQDSTVSIEQAPGVRKAIPQAQFHPIERAGHLPHMERTDVVNPVLISFLRSNVASKADTVSSPR